MVWDRFAMFKCWIKGFWGIINSCVDSFCGYNVRNETILNEVYYTMSEKKDNSMKEPEKGKTPASGPSGKGPKALFGMNRSPFGWLVIGLVVMSLLMVAGRYKSFEEISYIPGLVDFINNGQVESIRFDQTQIVGTFNEKGIGARPKGSPARFKVYYHSAMHQETLMALCDGKGVVVKGTQPNTMGIVLMNLLPILLLVGLIYFMFIRGARAGGGMLMNFGRSKHRVRRDGQTNVTFADVAGIDEAKSEVAETIDFLKNPGIFIQEVMTIILLSGT